MKLQAGTIGRKAQNRGEQIMTPAAIPDRFNLSPAIHRHDVEQAEQSHTTEKQYCGQIAIGRQVGDGP